jgi:hypothetical protein
VLFSLSTLEPSFSLHDELGVFSSFLFITPTDMLLCADFFGSDEVAADAHCDDSLYLWFLGTEPEYEGIIQYNSYL